MGTLVTRRNSSRSTASTKPHGSTEQLVGAVVIARKGQYVLLRVDSAVSLSLVVGVARAAGVGREVSAVNRCGSSMA
jgi:hypothetical protein